MLGKPHDTSGELPRVLLGSSSVIGVAHALGPTSGNSRLHGWGRRGWGMLWPGQSSHCQDLGVLNAPHTLERKEQPGKLGVVGAGAASLAALAVQLSSPRTPLFILPTGLVLGPPHPTVSLFIK